MRWSTCFALEGVLCLTMACCLKHMGSEWTDWAVLAAAGFSVASLPWRSYQRPAPAENARRYTQEESTW